MIRVALDSNILVYLTYSGREPSDIRKSRASQALLDTLRGRAAIATTTQALGELYVVLQRSGESRDDARAVVRDVMSAIEVLTPTQRDFVGALDLSVDHKLQFWDSLIVTASAEAGCSIFLSEDMQDGFVRHGMTIVNPFAKPMQPVLDTLLAN